MKQLLISLFLFLLQVAIDQYIWGNVYHLCAGETLEPVACDLRDPSGSVDPTSLLLLPLLVAVCIVSGCPRRPSASSVSALFAARFTGFSRRLSSSSPAVMDIQAGAVVVSVDYHLSPEHPLPAAYDDAWTALTWVLRSARSGAEPWLSRRADLTRLFLAGDSAGGNMAHNMAMRAGREGLDGGAAVRGIALLDPYFWGKRPVASETRDPAERRRNDRIWSFVCAGRYGLDDPVVNPVAMAGDEWQRLGCARVLVTVAGLDVLSARGRAYVEALRASGWGGEVRLYETPGEYHVYFLLKPDGEKAAKEMDAVVAFINGDRSVGSTKPEGSAEYTEIS
ncbi:putative carboxylesterase 12 [Hordeum vulgare]|nr:putative carboxylesterase 12 [Hordeum vulgare]